MAEEKLDPQGEALRESILAAMIAHEYHSPNHPTLQLVNREHLRRLRGEAHAAALTDYEARMESGHD